LSREGGGQDGQTEILDPTGASPSVAVAFRPTLLPLGLAEKPSLLAGGRGGRTPNTTGRAPVNRPVQCLASAHAAQRECRPPRRKPGGLVYHTNTTLRPSRDGRPLPSGGPAEAVWSSTLVLRSRSILPEARRPAPHLDPATALAAQASSEVWQPSLCRATVGEDKDRFDTDVGWPRMDEADVAE